MRSPNINQVRLRVFSLSHAPNTFGSPHLWCLRITGTLHFWCYSRLLRAISSSLLLSWNPPRVHHLLTELGHGNSDHPERLAWLKVPTGVSGSAIAQCAPKSPGQSKPLSNLNRISACREATGPWRLPRWEDTTRPIIVTKPLQSQFNELLIAPVRVLKQSGKPPWKWLFWLIDLTSVKGQVLSGRLSRLLHDPFKMEVPHFAGPFLVVSNPSSFQGQRFPYARGYPCQTSMRPSVQLIAVHFSLRHSRIPRLV